MSTFDLTLDVLKNAILFLHQSLSGVWKFKHAPAFNIFRKAGT